MALVLRPTFVQSPKPTWRSLTMAMNNFNISSSLDMPQRKLPILLFDVMDTIVRDPFYKDVPDFFRFYVRRRITDELFSFGDYEIDDWCLWRMFVMELAAKFFKDGRPVDLEGLKECMRRGYSYIDGVEALLHNLKLNNYEIHAFTNYPIWYSLIEEKLKLSTYLSWTFCSCITGKRKPAADSYSDVSTRLGVEPASCIFIDDRVVNVEAAVNAGMVGLHFNSAASLLQDLSHLGILSHRLRHEDILHPDPAMPTEERLP